MDYCPNCSKDCKPINPDGFCSPKCEVSYEAFIDSMHQYDRGEIAIKDAIEVLDWSLRDMKEPVQQIHGITCRRSLWKTL